MKLSLVAAINRSNVIGLNNKIPWHNTEDILNFKRLTTGHAVIMGRNTYESIGKPLSNRINYVLSRRPLQLANNVIRIGDDYLEYIRCIKDEVFVIGGASVYFQLAHLISTMYLTIIDDYTDSSAAVYFPWEAFHSRRWKVVEQRKWNKALYIVINNEENIDIK